MILGSISELQESGFQGFVSVSALQESKCLKVPDAPGVYCVLRPSTKPPIFLRRSTGGHFKGKDPTVAVHLLQSKWVDNALVLNIGKAGGNGKTPLKTRINQYMLFGRGRPVGHRGGRFIWQLGDSQDLILCWNLTPNSNPRNLEKALLRKFEEAYLRLPFANLRH